MTATPTVTTATAQITTITVGTSRLLTKNMVYQLRRAELTPYNFDQFDLMGFCTQLDRKLYPTGQTFLARDKENKDELVTLTRDEMFIDTLNPPTFPLTMGKPDYDAAGLTKDQYPLVCTQQPPKTLERLRLLSEYPHARFDLDDEKYGSHVKCDELTHAQCSETGISLRGSHTVFELEAQREYENIARVKGYQAQLNALPRIILGR